MKNELSLETSPYLLQHAHNPVHWQPWGDNALQIAKDLDKPILVSIGYSACHWCHVMERESFENEDTAALMNEHFVNIKIDREERPDIDHIYMDAVQAIAGNGGWPLNVFLTPEGKPFYGGTYFPPVKAHGRASWPDVLMSIHDAWINKRDEMEEQANTLLNHLKKSNNFGQMKSSITLNMDEPIFTKEDCITITNALLSNADKIEGGFGKAPKFPQTFSINALLQAAYMLKDEHALAQAELSLKKMFYGGIYDQLAGGLCRYSTDEEWLAPHFEKMLYDNALFIISLSNAYLYTKKPLYKNAVVDVCNFLFKEMKNPNGGYYAAIDADSEGVEGKFYVWDKNEIDEILRKDAAFFNAHFDVTENGNWEEKNILRIKKPLEDVAKEFGITLVDAEKLILKAKASLLQVRNKKIRPATDDKILLGWNALLITAFCKAYAIIQEDKYKIAAEDLFAFIEKTFTKENAELFHTYKNGEAKYPAFLDDYAYIIDACIHLQEITGNETYLHKAKAYTDYIMEHFVDVESNFFFFTQKSQTDVIMRKIELYDGATPAANSIMAKDLLYLSLVFDNKEWHNKAFNMIESLKSIVLKHPNSFSIWATLAMNVAIGINEVAIIGKDMIPLLQKVLLEYLPNKILLSSEVNSELPLLKGKVNIDKTSLFLCRSFVCSKPLITTEELIFAIEKQSFLQ
jgi:uncharacterized protein